MKLTDSSKMGRLIDSEPGLCRELVGRRQGDPQRACFAIPNETIELSGVQSEPESNRRQINASPRSIFGFDRHFISGNRKIPPETNPSEIRVAHNIGPGIPGVSEDVRPIVSG